MPRRRKDDEVTPGQRALWVFLASTLLGPFHGALLVVAGAFVGNLAGFGMLQGVGGDQLGPLLARRGLETYVWAAFPAAIAGALSAAWLNLQGTLPWLVMATAAAVATTLAAVIAGGALLNSITAIAFVAACAGITVWALLRRAGIVR